MAGYTPLFSSLTTGTLCGRWPDIGLWPIILSLSDRHGVVDVTPAYLAGVTGLQLESIVECMKRFCQPDPYSRSPKDAGARLVLLDEHRDWGWKIVNHGLYREKARLMMREIERVSSGENKARMQARKTPVDPRSPPKTHSDPPSDSDSDSDSDKKSEVPDTSSGGVGGEAPRKRSAEPKGSRIPTPFIVTGEMRKWAAEKTPHVNLDAATEDFCNYWRALPGQRSRKLDWVLTWKNRMKECEDKAMRSNGRAPPRELIGDTIARLNREADEAGEPRL